MSTKSIFVMALLAGCASSAFAGRFTSVANGVASATASSGTRGSVATTFNSSTRGSMANTFNNSARATTTSTMAMRPATIATTSARSQSAARDGMRAVRLARKFNTAATNGVRPTPNFNANAGQRYEMKDRFNIAAKTYVEPRRAPPDAPKNWGFAQGGGARQTYEAGTVFKQYGTGSSRYVTTDLAAKPTHVALPVKTETPPARYYKLTQTQRYPSGTVDRAYSQLAGANQVLLDQRVRLAPLQRTVTPNFADAAAPGLRR